MSPPTILHRETQHYLSFLAAEMLCSYGGIQLGLSMTAHNPAIASMILAATITETARVLINRTILNERWFPNPSYFIDQDLYMLARRLTKPICQRSRHLHFRNGVTAVKLGDAHSGLIKGLGEGPDVAIFGTGHADEPNIWNNPEKRESAVKEGMDQLFEEVIAIAKKRRLSPRDLFKKGLIGSITKDIAGIDIWRFDQEPRDWTVQQVSKRVHRETILSPTISSIIRQSAEEFLTRLRLITKVNQGSSA